MRGSLAQLLRQSGRGLRSYASAAEVAVAEESPFLRFSSPFPQTVSYAQALATVPETKVGGSRR